MNQINQGIDALTNELILRFGSRLCPNEPMAAHTALKVGGPARLWLSVDDLDELVESIRLARKYQQPVLLLGGGTNLLVSDRGIDGLVIQNRCNKVTLADNDKPHVIAEGGKNLASLARQVARSGLSGLEWAAGLPGTVGGAVVNNAGAHGACMADLLVQAEVLMPDTQRLWLPVEWFDYGYRQSRLKQLPVSGGEHVLLQAELEFVHGKVEEIEALLDDYSARRKNRQPAEASAGSVFKNPPENYAARLIEAVGLKGTSIGGAQVSPRHANFFVNQGDATAADFVALIELAQSKVKEAFGIDLELEVQKIGDWSV
jgi:UDP-N-acetylmuramate dehydrogenase